MSAFSFIQTHYEQSILQSCRHTSNHTIVSKTALNVCWCKAINCEDIVPVQEGGGTSPVRLSIAPNPSHLEFIGPVVLGMVRAEQTRLQDTARQKVMGLLIHGDAAFAGLGVVAECLQLADTPGTAQRPPPFVCFRL